MAAPRLPFLWPILWKSAESQTPAIRAARAASRRQAIHSSPRRRQQETISQRYGTANEPPPSLGGGKGIGPSTQQFQSEQAKLPKIGKKLQKDGEEEVNEEHTVEAKDETQDTAKRTEPTTMDGEPSRPIQGDPMFDAPDTLPSKEPPPAADGAVEKLLDGIPGPTPTQQEAAPLLETTEEHPDRTFDEHSPPIKAPHIEAPRYVHHFDTYGLVKRLEEAGWSDQHAVTAMKAVRLMLADNMELAKEALVSKSMVENETYLFRAACAELKTEVTARRKAEQEKMRTERSQLQHEVEILSQRVGQEAAGLKDELKGMFDDRKMAVRNEQRGMESKVQELNYKITVNLQADARSEVEGLRMVMTRRVIITLGVLVFMILGSLRLYSSALHEQEMEAKRRANQRSGGTQTEERAEYVTAGSGSNGGTGAERLDGKALGGGEMLVKEGDNPAFVSLG